MPGRNTGPFKAVKFKRRPAEQRRQAAHQRVQPHVGDGDDRPVSSDLHGVYHRVKHSIVPSDRNKLERNWARCTPKFRQTVCKSGFCLRGPADWPVDGYGSQGEHAGRADEQVKQSSKVTPHDPEHPLSPDRAHSHERQHQHGQQQVGQRQAEHKLVAGRQQVRPAIQRGHDQEIPQAGEQRDGHDGDRLQGSQTLSARHRSAVPTGVHGELLGHRTGEETAGDCQEKDVLITNP